MVYLRVILPVVAAGLMMGSQTVWADMWTDNGPVFESDRRAQEEREAAERAANRKTYEPTVYPKYMEGGERPDFKPAVPPIVYLDRNEEPGSIIVDTQARKLYFVLPGKKAYAYPISVGRDGFTWTGTERISRIAEWPSWTPPPEMRQRVPGLPVTVSGGMKNPQGARALYLGSTIYRIHGTNNDRTVGRANSSGCFRLTNEHVVHLASIAKVGAKVQVMQSYAGSVSENAPLSSIFGFLSPEPAAKPAKPEKKKKQVVQKKKPAAPAAATVQVGQPAAAPAIAAPSAPTPPATTASAETPAAAAASAAAEAAAAAKEARAAAAEAVAAARAAASAGTAKTVSAE
jgi:lipoprotein-anchoring transpeptidase ErfK/SrfK